MPSLTYFLSFVADYGKHMTEFVREWIVGITCAALIAAICDILIPEGVSRKTLKFAGGILLLLAAVLPILKIDGVLSADNCTQTDMHVDDRKEELIQQKDKLSKSVIEDSIEAYIEDKAMEIGIKCQIYVTAVKSTENYYIPESVVIIGDLTHEQVTELSSLLNSDLRIAPDKQTFKEAEE